MDAETYPMVGQRIDLFGPSVEFLTPTSEAKGAFCVLRGVVPPESRRGRCHARSGRRDAAHGNHTSRRVRMDVRPMTAHEIEATAPSNSSATPDANDRSERRPTLETAGRAIMRWLVYAALCAAADGATYQGGMWRNPTTSTASPR